MYRTKLRDEWWDDNTKTKFVSVQMMKNTAVLADLSNKILNDVIH